MSRWQPGRCAPGLGTRVSGCTHRITSRSPECLWRPRGETNNKSQVGKSRKTLQTSQNMKIMVFMERLLEPLGSASSCVFLAVSALSGHHRGFSHHRGSRKQRRLLPPHHHQRHPRVLLVGLVGGGGSTGTWVLHPPRLCYGHRGTVGECHTAGLPRRPTTQDRLAVLWWQGAPATASLHSRPLATAAGHWPGWALCGRLSLEVTHVGCGQEGSRSASGPAADLPPPPGHSKLVFWQKSEQLPPR